MRASQFLLKTTKDDPAEAEIVSHRLMLRSGMIKKVAAGLYSWLPVGLRVFRKVESIAVSYTHLRAHETPLHLV